MRYVGGSLPNERNMSPVGFFFYSEKFLVLFFDEIIPRTQVLISAVAFLIRLAVLWIDDSLESLASLVGGDGVVWPRAGCGIFDLHGQIHSNGGRVSNQTQPLPSRHPSLVASHSDPRGGPPIIKPSPIPISPC